MPKTVDISTIKKIYFLGIGGIGMSALAKYFLNAGVEIYGYDVTETVLTDRLEDMGMNIHYNMDPGVIPSDIDIVVYTPAIPDDHREWAAIRSMHVPILKRAEVLGLISHQHKTIAVAGTHGKTSTSALITHVLKASGMDVIAFVGGIMKNYDSNFIYGESGWMVAEADEFDRSFLHLDPDIAILNSVDPDHLDIYGNHQEMLATFRDFTMRIKEGGTLLVHQDVLQSMSQGWKKDLLERNIEMYSFGVDEGWYHASNVSIVNNRYAFDFSIGQNKILETSLQMPGRHNVSNAVAALAVSKILELDEIFVSEAIENFEGIKRRFEFIRSTEDQIVIDDYAHHPSEIDAAIKTVKNMYPDKKLTVIFQPHLFSRTRDFMQGFADSLDKADQLIAMPIYPAREKPINGISTEAMVLKMKDQKDADILNHDGVKEWIDTHKPELLLILGAGNISLIADYINENW